MPLVSDALDGWKLNRIAHPPYHVEAITYGPQYSPQLAGKKSWPQVCDRYGTVAISRDGAVFCATTEQAEQLCALANSGALKD